MVTMLTDKDKIEGEEQKQHKESVDIISNNNNNNNNNDNVVHHHFDFRSKLFIEDEIEVADTLLNLPYMVSKNLADYRFQNYWGFKKRRSALDSPMPRKFAAAQPQQPPQAATTATTSSPDTPLSFPLNESDGSKSKHISTTKKKYKSTTTSIIKKTRVELEQLEQGERERKQILLQEIEKKKHHLQNLQAENYELLAKKQKLIQVDKGLNENPMTEYAQQKHKHPHPATALALGNDHVHASPSTSTQFLHHHHPHPHPHPHPPLIFPNHPLTLIINNNPTVQLQPQFHQQMGPPPPQLDLDLDLDLRLQYLPPAAAAAAAADVIDEEMKKREECRARRQTRSLLNRSKRMARVR